MSQAPRKPPREYDITDDKKLMLWGPPIRPDGFPIRAKWSIDENGPVLEIDSGTKTEKGFTVDIKFPMTLTNAKVILQMIQKVASFKGGDLAFEFDLSGHPWMWNKDLGKNVKSKEKLLLGRLQLEKRSDGQVSLTAAARNKPEMRFDFNPNEYLTITQNGAPVPVSISSPEVAYAWASQWDQILTQTIERNWKEPDYQRKFRLEKAAENANKHRGGGGGGGNSYQQRPQQQQQRPQQQYQQQQAAPAHEAPGHDSFDTFDEELAF